MRDVYITNAGTLKRKDNTLFLIINDKKHIIPVNEVISIYVLADINFNSDVMEFLNYHNIPVHFFNYTGFYAGTFTPKTQNPSGNILIAQVNYYEDPKLRIEIAREFVKSAIHNIRKTLMHYSLKVLKLDEVLGKIDLAGDINTLMGYEATARKYYYSQFNKIMKNHEFEFIKRQRRPPTDPINALISFGNSLLYNTCLNEIWKTPLDPRISYLHEPFERRFSLKLDISEIFKPLIVDRVIFMMVNKKMLNEDDFQTETNFCFLSKNGRRKFIENYDKRLKETIKHPTLKRTVSYRHLIRIECYKIIKHLIEGKKYKGFRIYW